MRNRLWRLDQFAEHLHWHNRVSRTAQQAALQGCQAAHMQQHHGRSNSAGLQCKRTCVGRHYGLRRSAQAAALTVKIRPPVKAKKASMLRSPKWIGQAGCAPPAALSRRLCGQLCGSALAGRLSGIENGCRGRRFRIARTGLPHPAPVEYRQNSCPHAHGA